jgi:putative cell wall-binding protein
MAGTPAIAAQLPTTAGEALVDSSTTVQVEGTIVVVSGLGQDGDAALVTPLPDRVRLRTDSGETITITGPLTEGIVSGSEFSGTLAVPAEAAPAINAAVEVALSEADASSSQRRESSHLDSEILAASSELAAPLVVVEATITAPLEAAAIAPRAHAVDVMLFATNLVQPDEDYAFTDADVAARIQTLSTYWASQSGGQVARIDTPLNVKRKVVPVNTACDADLAWDEASSAFGDPRGDSYFTASGARHLLVVVPEICGAGNGWGTVGTLTSGGLIWVSHETLVGTTTIAHEFGHNLGLSHSNAHLCPGQLVEGTPQANGSFSGGCYDDEYMDAYDIMGATFSEHLPALNLTQKARLGALSAADLPSLTRAATFGSTAQTYALNPISAPNGPRGIRVVDPATGSEYFVEYRSGTGIDSGAFYTRNREQLSPGVRVLRLRSDTSSAALTLPNPTNPGLRNYALKTGESLKIPSGNLTVSAGEIGTTASVTITLGSGPVLPTVDRISGSDRYSTAVAISQAGYSATAPVVYVATGENYPDALSAAPAAAVQGGPLLLTQPGTVPESVRNEIQRLNPKQIVVVGGPTAISESVVAQLKLLAPTVTRLAGADRFETGRAVVSHAFPGTSASAYIATGLNYPDALSASAAAGSAGIPVVLVNGAASSVDAATKALLTTMKVSSVTVVGGPQAVSDGVSTSLNSVAPVTRISGTDRFDTSQKINKAAFGSAAHAYFATGLQFPDALAGAALAGSRHSPLYVVQPTFIPAPICADLVGYRTTAMTLFGGVQALSPAVQSLAGCESVYR